MYDRITNEIDLPLTKGIAMFHSGDPPTYPTPTEPTTTPGFEPTPVEPYNPGDNGNNGGDAGNGNDQS